MLGDPSGVNLKNTFNYSVGAAVALVGSTIVMASYDYAQASSSLAKDAHDIFGAFSGPLSDRATLTVYGIGGLSKGSPDFETGLVFTVKLR